MKAIRYNRNVQSWHWSQGIGEELIYFPESSVIVYNGHSAGQSYKGITSDSKFIEEAEQYVLDIKNGKVNKYIDKEHQEIQEKGFDVNDVNKNWSSQSLLAKDRTYIQEIPEQKTENSTIAAVTLSNYEEIEVNITQEEIKTISRKQIDFTMKKAAFEIEKRIFEDTIGNINNLIIK